MTRFGAAAKLQNLGRPGVSNRQSVAVTSAWAIGRRRAKLPKSRSKAMTAR
jgi:hypothetical protein